MDSGSAFVVDGGDLRTYRTEIPNIIDDMDLSPFAFRLYARVKRIAGDAGVCFGGLRGLAEACRMSVTTCRRAKQELVDARLIKVRPGDRTRHEADEIFIVDIWLRNMQHFSPDQRPLDASLEGTRVPGRRHIEETPAKEVYLTGGGGVPHRKGGVPHRKGGVPHRKGGVPHRKGGVPVREGGCTSQEGGCASGSTQEEVPIEKSTNVLQKNFQKKTAGTTAPDGISSSGGNSDSSSDGKKSEKPKRSRKTIPAYTDEQCERYWTLLMERSLFADDLRAFASMLGERNKTRRIAVSRAWKEIGHPFGSRWKVGGISREAWAYAFARAAEKRPRNFSYVIAAAEGKQEELDRGGFVPKAGEMAGGVPGEAAEKADSGSPEVVVRAIAAYDRDGDTSLRRFASLANRWDFTREEEPPWRIAVEISRDANERGQMLKRLRSVSRRAVREAVREAGQSVVGVSV